MIVDFKNIGNQILQAIFDASFYKDVGDSPRLMSTKKLSNPYVARPSFLPLPNDDITAIRLREIACDIHSARVSFSCSSMHYAHNTHNGLNPLGWRQCQLGQDSGEYISQALVDIYPLDIQSTYIDSEEAAQSVYAGD